MNEQTNKLELENKTSKSKITDLNEIINEQSNENANKYIS